MEHALADEIQSYASDPVRIAHLVDGALGIIEAQHVSNDVFAHVDPRNFMVDDTDRISIFGARPTPDARYAAPDAELTPASNVYAMGAILRDLLADRPNIPPSVRDVIARATDATPSVRPSIAAMRDALADLALGSPAYGRWLPAFAPADQRERELVIAARRDPDARLVYADWLEERGLDGRARFVRDEAPGPVEEATWRALVSRAPIIGCTGATCANTWDQLEPLAFDNIRRCPGCTRPVFYCASLEVVMVYAHRDLPIAADATIGRAIAESAYRVVPRYGRNPPRPFRTVNPPAPRGYVERSPRALEGSPREGNLLTRLFGLFRRR